MPALRVRMLAAFEVYLGDTILDAGAWRRKSARALFALLLLHPGGIAREAAAEALWPEGDPDAGSRDLRVALTGLRNAIEPAPTKSAVRHPPSRLPARQNVLRLNLFAEDEVDIHAFTQPDDLSSLALAELQQLASLYQGELLPEFRYEEWTSAARKSLRARWQALMRLLATRFEEAGQPEQALAALQRLLTYEPTHEAAARRSMQLLAAAGQRDQALHVYARLQSALWDDLAVQPDPATERLAEQIRTEGTRSLPQERSDRLVEITAEIHRLTVDSPSPEVGRELIRLWSERALVYNELNEYDAALSSIAHGRAILSDGEYPAEEARLVWAEALAHDLHGAQQQALDLVVEAGTLAHRGGDAELETKILISTAHILEQLGRPVEAIEAANAACWAAEELGVAEMQLHARRVAAFSTWRAGRMAEAEALHRRNLSDARALGKEEWEGYILCGLASALVPQGKLVEAEAALLDARGVAERTNDEHLNLYIEYHLGGLWRERAYLSTGEFRRGASTSQAVGDARATTREHLERSLRLAQADDVPYMTLFSALDLAGAYLDWDDADSAQRMMCTVRDQAQTLPTGGNVEGWVEVGEARLALALSDTEGSARHATVAIATLEAASPGGLAETHRVAALADTRRQDITSARRHWQGSRDAARRCGQKLEELRTRNAFLRSHQGAILPVG